MAPQDIDFETDGFSGTDQGLDLVRRRELLDNQAGIEGSRMNAAQTAERPEEIRLREARFQIDSIRSLML